MDFVIFGNMILSELLVYCAIGIAAIVALMIFSAVCWLSFSQLILRHSVTDAQWFWFSSEPKGLVALRNGQKIHNTEHPSISCFNY